MLCCIAAPPRTKANGSAPDVFLCWFRRCQTHTAAAQFPVSVHLITFHRKRVVTIHVFTENNNFTGYLELLLRAKRARSLPNHCCTWLISKWLAQPWTVTTCSLPTKKCLKIVCIYFNNTWLPMLLLAAKLMAHVQTIFRHPLALTPIQAVLHLTVDNHLCAVLGKTPNRFNSCFSEQLSTATENT